MKKKRIGAFILAAAMAVSAQTGTMVVQIPGINGMEIAEASDLSSTVGLYASFYHKYIKIHIINCFEEQLTGVLTVTGYDSNGKYFSDRINFSANADSSAYIKPQHRNAVKATVVLSNLKVGGKSIEGTITKSFED